MNETYLLEVHVLYNYLLKHLTSSKPQSAIVNWEMNFFPVCATGSQTNYISHKILTSCSSSLNKEEITVSIYYHAFIYSQPLKIEGKR